MYSLPGSLLHRMETEGASAGKPPDRCTIQLPCPLVTANIIVFNADCFPFPASRDPCTMKRVAVRPASSCNDAAGQVCDHDRTDQNSQTQAPVINDVRLCPAVQCA